jgi:hypothetical protein
VRFLQGSDHAPPRSSILLHLVGPPDGDETAAVARGYPYYSAMLMDDWKLCVAQQPTTSNALSCPAATLFGAGMPAVCLTHLATAPGGGASRIVGMGEAPCLPPPGADPTIPFNVSGNACTAEATGWISLNETVRLYHKPTPAQSCADPSHPVRKNVSPLFLEFSLCLSEPVLAK